MDKMNAVMWSAVILRARADFIFRLRGYFKMNAVNIVLISKIYGVPLIFRLRGYFKWGR